MAKIALFKCVSKDCSEVVYDFELVEDYIKTPPPEQEQTESSTPDSGETAAREPLMKNYMPQDHPLSLMVFFLHSLAGRSIRCFFVLVLGSRFCHT